MIWLVMGLVTALWFELLIRPLILTPEERVWVWFEMADEELRRDG